VKRQHDNFGGGAEKGERRKRSIRQDRRHLSTIGKKRSDHPISSNSAKEQFGIVKGFGNRLTPEIRMKHHKGKRSTGRETIGGRNLKSRKDILEPK